MLTATPVPMFFRGNAAFFTTATPVPMLPQHQSLC